MAAVRASTAFDVAGAVDDRQGHHPDHGTEDHMGCGLDPSALWELPTEASFAGLLAGHASPR
jgi:hypothetical protein